MSERRAVGLRTPRSVNWNLELDRELMHDLFVRVGYRERENRFESVVDPVDAGERGNRRRRCEPTAARAIERRRSRRATPSTATDQIVGSYTRSSAFGNLNDFNGFFGNIENPVIRPDAQGPLPWDAPNRVLLWSSISLPRRLRRIPRARHAERIPAVHYRRRPQLRRVAQSGRPLPDVRLGRHADHEEAAACSTTTRRSA